MELFQKLFGELLLFVYHCFDRIVINGYLSGLSRPEQVVHFFRQVIGVPILSKEVIAQRTNDYQNWVEAFAAQPPAPHPVGRKRCPQRGLCAALVAPNAQEEHLRSLFHFQEHGTRAHLPDQRAEVSDPGPQPPDPGASTQPLHALLLLHLRSSAWTDGHARSVILALPGHLLSKRPLLYRTGTQESPGRLPQER